MPFAVLGAVLGVLVGACGNGFNGHGAYHPNVQITYEPIAPASATGGRATLAISDIDLRMQGTIDLRPPPARESPERAGSHSQPDLVSERRMVVRVRIDENWAEWWRAREQEVEITIRGDALLHSVPPPADAIAGLAHPAVQASHSAEVVIWPGLIADGGTPERLHFTGTGRGRTLSEDAGRDNLLIYDLDATLTHERIMRVRQMIIASEFERRRVAELSQLVSIQLMLLDEYRRARGRGYPANYFENTDEILRILGWHIGYRQWGEPALGTYRDALAELFVVLTNAREAARAAKPGPKSAGQHAIDVLMVLPHTAKTLVDGVVETGRMVRDLGTYTTAVFGQKAGLWEFGWEPWSAVGQAYAAGKSTGEIACSVVDGISDSIDFALYAAENGDYAPLMNLGGEITVELLLARGLGKAANARKLAQTSDNAMPMGARVAERYRRVIDRARDLRARATNLPARARDELDALIEALGRALEPQRVTAGAPNGLLTALDDLRHIYASARLEKARARTLLILESRATLSTSAKAGARNIIARLERTATTSAAAQSARAVLAYIDELEHPVEFLTALDRTLAVAHRIESDRVAALVHKATQAADPIGYLDDVRWLSTLAPDARAKLAGLIAENRAPDLTWLRAADLDLEDLRQLVLDNTTNWALLQRRSQLAEDLPREIRAVIGKRVDELPYAPPGTEFWTTARGRKQIRWQKGNATGRPSLSLDSHGRIVAGGADDLNRAVLSRNMRKKDPKLEGHHDHHIVPIEIARDHPLFRAARSRGEPRWDPNHPDNGIQLPASKEARDKILASQGLPIHNASHAGYSRSVAEVAENLKHVLEARYGTLDKVPGAELTAAAKQVETKMRENLKVWTKEHGEELR